VVVEHEHTRQSGQLSTHVLDTAGGRPAAGVVVELYRLGPDGARALVTRVTTNADGRTDRPLLEGDAFILGAYELVFAIGDYFRAQGLIRETPAFLESVPIRFHLNALSQTYHVPLVCSPWSYATYRGS
jgi:5-hydroxyisourate hydrolase